MRRGEEQRRIYKLDCRCLFYNVLGFDRVQKAHQSPLEGNKKWLTLTQFPKNKERV